MDKNQPAHAFFEFAIASHASVRRPPTLSFKPFILDDILRWLQLNIRVIADIEMDQPCRRGVKLIDNLFAANFALAFSLE